MPYCKLKSIHTTVQNTLNYILNLDKCRMHLSGQPQSAHDARIQGCREKQDELLYADSLNCFTDAQCAYENMKMVYEHYSGRSFTAPMPEKGNCPIKAIHLIQSFSPEDGVTPEQVHEIGMELVRRLYGDKAQAVIATHVDKEHIHNHVCICSYTTDGKKLYNTISEVKRLRDLSDLICKERGIRNVMEDRSNCKTTSMTYGEWKHRKQGVSWKAKITEYIDTLIPIVESLGQLLKIMQAHGYTVRDGKYKSVLAPGQQRAIRLKSLGKGYDEVSLAKRIAAFVAARPKIRTPDEILAEVTREFIGKTHKIGFARSVKDKTAELGQQLTLVNSEHISSVGEAESRLHDTENEIYKLNAAITDLEANIRHKQLLAAAAARYFRKYKLGEKREDYPLSQKKEDRLILQKNGITALSDVAGYDADVNADNRQLAELRTRHSELTAKTDTYRAIIDTCRDRNDFMTKLTKEVEKRLTEQEQAKIAAMKADTFTIYRPSVRHEYGFTSIDDSSNIDEYEVYAKGCMFDVDGKDRTSDDMGEKLEAIYQHYNLHVGYVIQMNQKSYYTNVKGFNAIRTFTQSAKAYHHQQAEELARQEQERITAEERRRQQEEEQRRKEEEKAKQQTTTQKKGSKPLKH